MTDQAEPQMTGGPALEAQTGAGDPDGLARLWTPHRLAYVQGSKPSAEAAGPSCPFCRVFSAPAADDEANLVVSRGVEVFALLNLYPYNPGHLMVLPNRHVADYTELTPSETLELADFTRRAMTVIRRVSAPHGFNIGMNQGAAAGAGIADHLHQHVVPRWGGDANFMPVIAQTKVLPQLLGQTRTMMADAWDLV